MKDLLSKLQLHQPLAGWKAVELWSEVVGERVASRSRAVAFRDGNLIVEVASPAWMTELTYLKRRIIRDMNQRLNATVITDIRLRPESLPARPETGVDKEGS